MAMKRAVLCGTALLLLLTTRCIVLSADTGGVVPRPLGKDVPTVALPGDPAVVLPPSADEPTGVVTLPQLLGIALQRHPDLSAFAFAVRAAEAHALQAGVLPNPDLSVTLENFAGTGATSGAKALETTVQLSQLVELGGKRVKRLRLASVERDVAAWDYEAKRLDVLTDVTKAFVDVVAAQERLALMEDLVRLAYQVHTTAAERVKAGKVSPVEETKAGVAVATVQLQVNQAHNVLDAAHKSLAATWGSTTPRFERVSGTLDTVVAPPSFPQLTALITQNPDVARWTTEMDARHATVTVEESKRIPNVTVAGGVRYANDTTSPSFVAGFSLPLPLFDRNQGGLLEARYRLAQAAYQRQAAAVRVSAALTEAYQTLTTAYTDVITLRDTILPATQQVFDATTEGYRLGKFGFLEVVDAQRTLFETRGRYLDALATYHKARAQVEHLIGEGLGTLTPSEGPTTQGGQR